MNGREGGVQDRSKTTEDEFEEKHIGVIKKTKMCMYYHDIGERSKALHR